MKKILLSLSIITAVAAIVIGGTFAYFSDVETSNGNVFTAGTLDLKTNDADGVTATWVLADMAPGGASVTGSMVLKNTGTVAGDHVEISVVNTPIENAINEPECVAYGGTWTGTCSVTFLDGVAGRNDIDKKLKITAMTYTGTSLIPADLNTICGGVAYDANQNGYLDLDDLEAASWTGEGCQLDNLAIPDTGGATPKTFSMTVQLDSSTDNNYQTDQNTMVITFVLNQDSTQ